MCSVLYYMQQFRHIGMHVILQLSVLDVTLCGLFVSKRKSASYFGCSHEIIECQSLRGFL